MQECIIDFVNIVYEHFQDKYQIYTQLVDEEYAEYVVTITSDLFIKEVRPISKVARGYLVISNDKMRIINCHLRPQQYVDSNVLDILREENRDKLVIIAGDFNETSVNVSKALNDIYKVPVYGLSYMKKDDIDHIIMLLINMICYIINMICYIIMICYLIMIQSY
jgi:hypothetical protein